jgi:hypothetical protein
MISLFDCQVNILSNIYFCTVLVFCFWNRNFHRETIYFNLNDYEKSKILIHGEIY